MNVHVNRYGHGLNLRRFVFIPAANPAVNPIKDGDYPKAAIDMKLNEERSINQSLNLMIGDGGFGIGMRRELDESSGLGLVFKVAGKDEGRT